MSGFLKRYSVIPNKFIDDMMQFYDERTRQTDFVIDVEWVATWLGVRKNSLRKTLHESYKQDIDFTETRGKANQESRGGQNHAFVMMTPDCFKRLCMRSSSSKGEEVRSYFIQIEALLMKYRDLMMDGMQAEIKRLERNQASKHSNAPGSPGYIYVIRASAHNDSRVKIGRAKNLGRRLTSHSSADADDLEVLWTFRTDHMVEVEGCLKALMKAKQYRKYKEVYEVDVDTIKALVQGCSDLSENAGLLKGRPTVSKAKKGAPVMTGGYYACLIRD